MTEKMLTSQRRRSPPSCSQCGGAEAAENCATLLCGCVCTGVCRFANNFSSCTSLLSCSSSPDGGLALRLRGIQTVGTGLVLIQVFWKLFGVSVCIMWTAGKGFYLHDSVCDIKCKIPSNVTIHKFDIKKRYKIGAELLQTLGVGKGAV